MGKLQIEFAQVISDQFEPSNIMGWLIALQLRNAGIELDQQQLKHLLHEVSEQLPSEGLEDTPNVSINLTFDVDQDLGERISKALKAPFLSTSEIDEFVSRREKELAQVYTDMATKFGSELLDSWLQKSADLLGKERRIIREFTVSLDLTWGEALEKLEMLVSIASDAGADFVNTYEKDALESDDHVFDALVFLFARGCQVAREILALLKNGFADGAHARWRTLHEIAITASFIRKHGKDVATRYLSHADIETYEAAKLHNKYCQSLNYEPVPAEEMAELERRRDKLVSVFGSDYENHYGWAALALKKGKPTFAQIEEDTELEHFRPIFKMATSNVHAGAKGIAFRLGVPFPESYSLLAGHSSFGLGDPSRDTAYTITLLTKIVLDSRQELDNLIYTSAMEKLMRKVCEAFDVAEANYESNLAAKQETTDDNSKI